jgi:glycosyltransferase involved in cell wall biosynthesis
MPYNIPVLKVLVSSGYNVVVLHDTIVRQTPYQPPLIEGVLFYPKESFNQIQLNQLAEQIKPCVTFIADRTNANYNKTGMLLRRRYKTPVIVGCDSQWLGGRQWINVLTSFVRHKRYYSHILVAGLRQFEYAKKLGFKNNRVLWPLYSANTDIFLASQINRSKFTGPRNILYVGRFAEVKGIRTLLYAWDALENKKGATLTMIGNGPIKNEIICPPDVKILDFKSQEEIIQIASQCSCFVLPSIFEPWALVIHEFASLGLPIIATSVCGASPHFVINNYNGFIVEPNDVKSLTNALQKIMQLNEEVLFNFSMRSRELSQSISPKLVANSILSVIK